MKKITFVIISVCLLIFSAFLHQGCAQAKPALPGKEFILKDLNGKSVALSSFKDTPVLLFFWTTWCPHCRAGLKDLQGRKDEMAKSGVKVLLINVGEEPGYVSQYVKANTITYSVLLDSKTEVANSYGLVGVPTFVLMNKTGQTVYTDYVFPAEYKKLLVK